MIVDVSWCLWQCKEIEFRTRVGVKFCSVRNRKTDSLEDVLSVRLSVSVPSSANRSENPVRSATPVTLNNKHRECNHNHSVGMVVVSSYRTVDGWFLLHRQMDGQCSRGCCWTDLTMPSIMAKTTFNSNTVVALRTVLCPSEKDTRK